jgi:hypothetical protein
LNNLKYKYTTQGINHHCHGEIRAILPIINVLLTKMCFSVCLSAK